jgi:hypothetical protein
LFKQAEIVLQDANPSLVSHKKNVRKNFSTEMQQTCVGITLPDCQKVASVMLSRFLTLRLLIWAKDQRALKKSQCQKAKDGELGSKCMATRMTVSKSKYMGSLSFSFTVTA